MNYKQIDYIVGDCNSILEGKVDSLFQLKGKSIYLTGASGFVGKWILQMVNFLNDNYDFNTFVTCHAKDIKDVAGSFPHLYDRKNILLVEGDIRNLSELNSETSFILHLAGSPDNRFHASDPIKMMNDIVVGTNRILESSILMERLEKFCFFSSGHVYGGLPMEEEGYDEGSFYGLNCSQTSSFYGEAKRCAESLVHSYRTQYKLPIAIFRPFAFVGPYQSIERPWAINNFIRDGLMKQPIRILGDEGTMRSYMYASEMAFWTLLGLVSSGKNQTYNLGSNKGRSLREVAQIVEKAFRSEQGIITNTPRQNSQRSKFIPNITSFENAFKLKLEIDSEAAIQKSIEWYLLGS